MYIGCIDTVIVHCVHWVYVCVFCTLSSVQSVSMYWSPRSSPLFWACLAPGLVCTRRVYADSSPSWMRSMTVVSSANFRSLMAGSLDVQSLVYMEKSSGERTQPWGAPVLSICVSGLCSFGLVLFMGLWQSPDCPVMSWFHVSECARAVRSLSLVCVSCFVSERGVRIPALMSWVSVSCRGSDTRAPCSVSSCEFARPRALLSTCVLLWCAACVFIGCVCEHVVYELSHWLCVWTRGLWVVSLAVCVNTWFMSCLISCVFVSCSAHGWWFVCWPCACVCVLCEHVASVLVFCVPCALMSIVLTPSILLPDNWLICPTCVSSLPSSSAPFIISVPGQFVIALPCQACQLSCFSSMG